MKVDYYIGKQPITLAERIEYNGIFTKWFEIISKQIDANTIYVTTRSDLAGKIIRRFQYWTGAHLVYQRRKDSILHFISANLVNPSLLGISRSPLIVTNFDAAIFEDNVAELTRPRGTRQIYATKKIMERADRITTVSNHAKNRISEVCGIEPPKIDVVYDGVDHTQFFPRKIEKSPEILKQYGLDPYKKNILYVGSESPRKNLKRLIRAIPFIRKEHEVYFVKVGVQDREYHQELLLLVRKLEIEDVVHLIPPISTDKLAMIYNLADLFLFPSLYEGFGIPPLEALASGCPVVTSNLTSIPEVVGDAAEKVDPYDIRSIASGAIKVLSNDQYRQDLIQKGVKQASKFSWKKKAQDFINIYHKLC